jgi:hypothetical protein
VIWEAELFADRRDGGRVSRLRQIEVITGRIRSRCTDDVTRRVRHPHDSPHPLRDIGHCAAQNRYDDDNTRHAARHSALHATTVLALTPAILKLGSIK